jgi:hypothetical protein
MRCRSKRKQRPTGTGDGLLHRHATTNAGWRPRGLTRALSGIRRHAGTPPTPAPTREENPGGRGLIDLPVVEVAQPGSGDDSPSKPTTAREKAVCLASRLRGVSG